jgi:hypothetical protein
MRHVAPLELENLWLATNYRHAARTGLAERWRGQLLGTALNFLPKIEVTPQPRRGTRDTQGKRMEMSLMKPAKLILVRPLAALVVRFVPFCGYA